MMKITALIFILATSLQITGSKPQIVISNEYGTILYQGTGNILKVLAENTSGRVIFLSTDNGTIKKYKNIFIVRPAKLGLATIRVFKVLKNDTVHLGTSTYFVKPLSPVARIAGLSGGPIKKETLLSALGIIAKVECCGFNYPATVMGYTMIATRDSVVIGIAKTTGPRYNDKCTELLNQLVANDHLIIHSLSTKLAETPIMHQPIEFIIEE